MGKHSYRRILLYVFVLALVSLSVGAHADADVVFQLNEEYTGATPPEGTAPWITASFFDVSPNNVRLTMSAHNLVGSEFISTWLFNSSETGLVFTPDGGNSSVIATPTVSQAQDGRTAGGNRLFDIEFSFNTAASANRFTAGETVIYNISGTSLSSSSFSLLSTSPGNKTQYYSAAHVQGIGSEGDDSGWIATTTVVPEPVSSTLFIVGAASLAFRRFRKGREKS